MRPLTTPMRRNAGFSLVELMVGLVAGMVVVGAVLAFTVSSIRANADFVGSARLTQELRSASQYVNSELRRAGYDEDAMAFLASASTETSEFAPILVDTTAGANCVSPWLRFRSVAASAFSRFISTKRAKPPFRPPCSCSWRGAWTYPPAISCRTLLVNILRRPRRKTDASVF